MSAVLLQRIVLAIAVVISGARDYRPPSTGDELVPSMRSVKLYLGRQKSFIVKTFTSPSDTTGILSPNFDAFIVDTAVAAMERQGDIEIRVRAKDYGSTEIVLRPHSNPDYVVRVPVKVIHNPPMLSWFGMGARATAKMISPFGPDVKRGRHYLEVHLTVTNLLPIWRKVPLMPCMLWVRVYRTPNHRDHPLDNRAGHLCWDSTTTRRRFAPFQSRREQTEYNLIAQTDRLPPGRYYVTALVDRGHNYLEVAAGTIVVRDWSEGLTMSSSVAVIGDTVEVRPVFHNGNNATLGFYYDRVGCGLSEVLVYRGDTASGSPAWRRSDLRRRDLRPQRPSTKSDSSHQLVEIHVEDWRCAGASAKIAAKDSASPPAAHVRIPVATILGDSLPDGNYFFGTVLVAGNKKFRSASGTLVLRR